MYVSYVKALTVAKKLNCIIFLIQPVLTKTYGLQCLAIKNTVNHLRYSVQFFPNTSAVTHEKCQENVILCFFLSLSQSFLSPGLPFLLACGPFVLSWWKLRHQFFFQLNQQTHMITPD